VASLGVQVAIVIGGGNIFRGVAASAVGMDRATADYMGMLATSSTRSPPGRAREGRPPDPRALSHRDAGGGRAVHPPARDSPSREGARGDLRGRDRQPVLHDRPAGALRAVEIGADVIVKATKVDGIYSADPKQDARASGSSG